MHCNLFNHIIVGKCDSTAFVETQLDSDADVLDAIPNSFADLVYAQSNTISTSPTPRYVAFLIQYSLVP